MLGAGTVINPIIKIVTTVAILAAVYIFIVKPTLDTTNDAFDSLGLDGLSGDIQDQVNNALDSTSNTGRLENCVDRATERDNVDQAIQRCLDQFGY